jgi:hypothetical protein
MTEQNQPAPAQKSYRPSGKVNFLIFIPLFIAAVVVACIMAVVLGVIQDYAYYFIIMPLLISLPILGMCWLMVRFGRCRLPVLAAAAGIVLILIYYLGFWTLSYWSFVNYYYPDGHEILKDETGSSGLWGYFLLRCKTGTISTTPGVDDKPREPTVVDKYFNYGFYGAEFVILLVAGAAVGLNTSRRIFYEGMKKWASAKQIHCRPGDFEPLLQIVGNRQWQKLSELPKLPKVSAGRSMSNLIFKVEFLKGATDAPAYVSVKGTNLGKATGAKGSSSLGKTFIKQMEISPAELALIAQQLPELNIPTQQVLPAQAASPVPPIQQMQPLSTPPLSKPTIEYDAGFKGWLQRIGLSSPRIVGPDFRLKAEAESKAIRSKYSMANLTDINASFCLPVDEQYRCDTRQTAGLHKRLLFSALGLALLGFPVLLIAAMLEPAGQKDLTPTGKVLLVIGLGLMVTGLIFLFLISTIHKNILKHRLLTRPGSLFEPSAAGPFMFFHLEDSKTYHVRKSLPEDFCLCVIDALRRRLLIEGCTYRYIVRAEDVLRLAPAETGTKISIDLTWKIGAEQLAVVLSRESMSAYAVNPLLTRNNAKRLTNKMRTGLGLPTL